MLTVFLIVLPAAFTADTDLGWERGPAGVGIAGGSRPAEGARRPLLGVVGVDLLKDAA